MEDKANGKRLDDTDDDVGNEANGRFHGRKSLYLLETKSIISNQWQLVKKIVTYNKLNKYSRLCTIAQVKKTMMQMEEKASSLHREFGIKAGLPRFSWRCTQKTKAGRQATAIVNRTICEASWMRWLSSDTTLQVDCELLNEMSISGRYVEDLR